MTGQKQHLRNPGVILGILAVIIAATGASFAVGYAASSKSNTIKACVAKGSGTLYQAHKCKKGDKKLKWSITGPTGATGATGPAGANGAVAGYSASQGADQTITNNNALVTVISKVVPAGNYIVDASAALTAISTANGNQGATEECQLSDGTHSNTVMVGGALGAVFIFWENQAVASMQIAASGASPLTLTLKCRNVLSAPPANFTVTVSDARITAVQTTTNS
jgi:hypothetical protein